MDGMNNRTPLAIALSGVLVAAAMIWAGYENGQAIRCSQVITDNGVRLLTVSEPNDRVVEFQGALGCDAILSGG